jgi:hypothetical protein
MDLIEQLGAFLGLAAFVGLAVLVLLYFQQARDVRRLREWAGRAPERAAEVAEEAATAAAREAGIEPAEGEPGHEASLRDRVMARLPSLPGASGRVPQWGYVAALAGGIALIVVVIVTGAFGLLGGEDGAADGGSEATPRGKIEVAVLNGTGVGGAPGVPGLAEGVAKKVKKAGYKLGPVSDAGLSFDDSVVMYASKGDETSAERVSADLRKLLGNADLLKMTSDINPLAKDASVAVVIGIEDSEL